MSIASFDRPRMCSADGQVDRHQRHIALIDFNDSVHIFGVHFERFCAVKCSENVRFWSVECPQNSQKHVLNSISEIWILDTSFFNYVW